MPRFEPFVGLRYAPALDAADVTSPPYDVIDGAERDALAARSPANAVHVDCPVGDGDCYADAAATLQGWVADGTLVADDAARFTIYRTTSRDEVGRTRTTTGVIGALTLERPDTGDVLPHERTTPKARSDRLDLLRATRANLSAVWGLSPAPGLGALLRPDGPPTLAVTDGDGVLHEAWVLDDPERAAAITDAVASAPVVIADGHHRYETCLAHQAEQGGARGGHDATMALVVELAPDELHVGPIHRVLSLGDGVDVRTVLARSFDLDARPGRPGADAVDVLEADGVLALVLPGEGWFALRPRADAPTPPYGLDSARLAAAVEGEAVELAYRHGVVDVVAAVDEGRADAAVLLRPVTVEQIAACAAARDRMPPKSTFFAPKPRTGVVFRPFDHP